MSDQYQAVYDAVRSRIGGCDIGSAVADVVRQQFDISFAVQACVQDVACSFAEHARPSAVYRPSLSIDGDQWCALYGANLQEGVAGFGDTPALAMSDFDRNWMGMSARAKEGGEHA
jgi:hypothetical protein